MTGRFASRISGSADVYQKAGKEPLNSINFITCHDGFTLNDLVSYNEAHNEANGEEGRDGASHNFSYNYGAEGETDDPEIEQTRIRQIKNLIATLFISRGVPLFLGGDEFRRTQKGNNNAFCQDNETSWYNWELLHKNREVFRFTREMISLRKRTAVLREVKFYTERDITWYGVDGGRPDWDYSARSFACMIHGVDELFIMFHADFSERMFLLPKAPRGKKWLRVVDTAKPPPDDIRPTGQEKPVERPGSYLLARRSMAILVAK